ncbi:hypothetical protein DPMN_006262 [Dreissena polymorpha]|uniref:Uncharacterized protein n=1 Tax=Dreissena polymorpha TaxID=45954 RepID=A0A9D4MW65_DREPO|nr:hypothetical protein DPMN_006262 [Dreissena polymorpha]
MLKSKTNSSPWTELLGMWWPSSWAEKQPQGSIQKIVRLGRSNVVNAPQKDITPRTVASALLVVSGVTVTPHHEPAPKVLLVVGTLCKRGRIRNQSMT